METIARERHAHQLSARLRPDALAAELREALGQTLVALIAGVSDVKAVGQWARGQRKPAFEALAWLRDAHHVLGILRRRPSVEAAPPPAPSGGTMRSIHLVTPGLPGILVQPTADWMRQGFHLYGDDGNLIGEDIGWVERYDDGKQWKGFTRRGALPFRRSRPDAARDVLREWFRWAHYVPHAAAKRRVGSARSATPRADDA